MRTFISMGSNLGDKEDNLRQAVKALNELKGTVIVKISSLYSTSPVGYLAQDDFLNAMVELNTDLEPQILLQSLQDIEHKLGRVRDIRWGPRTIDLDIILYGQMNIDQADLSVPHPRMNERAFVLVPLAELAPFLRIGEVSLQAMILQTQEQKINLFKKNWFGNI